MTQPTITLPEITDGEDKTSPIKNRIRKNYQHVRKWAKRTLTNCFRIYDRDIKEYPLAIDFYAGRFCVHFFSYEGDELSNELKDEIMKVLLELFKAGSKDIFWRVRAKRDKIEQYEKVADKEQFFTVLEYGVKFLINLTDYLDTGLFLDHRETRQMVASLAKGKSLLNLFAYTCSFSVQAAAQGARYTKSVDLSNTYTAWGRDNFIVNGLSLDNNEIIRADCLKYLEYDASSYDVIVIDPPTISRSKKMDQIFDIQMDYVSLIQHALQRLTPGGVIFFSTNSRKFKFDKTLFTGRSIQDITAKTIPLDFHNQKIHQCYLVRQSPAAFSTFSKVVAKD
ncbi:MAG: class I SAM-dependent methyltransferase [Rhabdochlamydiaceae bacterium]|nr:class I SAM-dependent methyltransferase [Rhabdochlamydiaceae bacterium]